MKKIIFIIFLLPAFSFAKVDVTVDELTNVARSAILEACGTAKSDQNSKIEVQVRHGGAVYSTTVDPKTNKWCVLFARRTFDGKIQVEATDSSSATQTLFAIPSATASKSVPAMTASAITAATEEFEKSETASVSLFVGIKGWQEGGRYAVKVYLSNNKTLSYSCSFMNHGGSEMMMCDKQ